MTFIAFSSYFVDRRTSLKNQKLVGEVVKHVENSENGMVHVRVRGIHDDWPEDALPRMQMKQGFGSGNKGGTTNPTEQIPPVGSKVFCQFEDDSHYHGQYFGGSATDDQKNGEFTGEENYGKTYGQADPAGNLFKVRTEEGKEDITTQHVSGTTQSMDKDGGFNVNAMKALNMAGESGQMSFDKDHKVDIGGDHHVKAKGTMIFEADNMEFRFKNAKATKPILPGAPGNEAPSARVKPTKRTRPTYNKPGDKV